MKINVIENKKNRLVFDIEGVSPAFCNVLKKEMYNDGHVKAASYKIEHPLISLPRFLVETDGDTAPVKALINAAKRLSKISEKLADDFAKELK